VGLAQEVLLYCERIRLLEEHKEDFFQDSFDFSCGVEDSCVCELRIYYYLTERAPLGALEL
jgi:hypothetical protein